MAEGANGAANTVEAPEKASVNVQLESRAAKLWRACGDAAKSLFTLDNLKGGSERISFVVLLWGIYTGWFIAFMMIGLAVRDSYGYIVLPEKQMSFNPETDVPGPLPWMTVSY